MLLVPLKQQRGFPEIAVGNKWYQKSDLLHGSEKEVTMNEATGRLFTREEHLQRIQSFSLFSDVFASVVFEDISACQHVLRVFTGKKDLCLKKVKTQYTISKTSTKSARLDVLAEDTEGIFYVMEIQRRKEINHPRRIRFYRGMLDSAFLEKGEDYAQLPQLEIFYVSETDVLEYGETVCQVCTSLGTCSNKVYDDGSYITFINAQIDDHSEIAALMRYFKTADPDDDSQGALSERVRYLKCKEGGIKRMCEIT